MTQFSSLYGALLHRELGTDETSTLFTNARRKLAINDAQREFAGLTACLQRRSTITITGGTAEYDLNSTTVIAGGDFVRLAVDGVEFKYTDKSSNVTYLAHDDLPRRDIPWLNQYLPGWRNDTVASTIKQLPSYYYLRADGPRLLLGFALKPCTGSSASAEALVTYEAFPTPLTSDTSEPFTVNSSVRIDLRPYHQGLVHYGASQLFKYIRDQERSQSQLQIFLGYVTRYFQDKRIKGGRAIRQARSYFAETRHGD